MVFLGGAVLANLVSLPVTVEYPPFVSTVLTLSLSSQQIADKEDMWVSKQEWQEQGPRVLSKLGPR